jgi:hypothetical protein
MFFELPAQEKSASFRKIRFVENIRKSIDSDLSEFRK